RKIRFRKAPLSRSPHYRVFRASPEHLSATSSLTKKLSECELLEARFHSFAASANVCPHSVSLQRCEAPHQRVVRSETAPPLEKAVYLRPETWRASFVRGGASMT